MPDQVERLIEDLFTPGSTPHNEECVDHNEEIALQAAHLAGALGGPQAARYEAWLAADPVRRLDIQAAEDLWREVQSARTSVSVTSHARPRAKLRDAAKALRGILALSGFGGRRYALISGAAACVVIAVAVGATQFASRRATPVDASQRQIASTQALVASQEQVREDNLGAAPAPAAQAALNPPPSVGVRDGPEARSLEVQPRGLVFAQAEDPQSECAAMRMRVQLLRTQLAVLEAQEAQLRLRAETPASQISAIGARRVAIEQELNAIGSAVSADCEPSNETGRVQPVNSTAEGPQ